MTASVALSIPFGFSGHLFQPLSGPDPLPSPAQAPLFPRELYFDLVIFNATKKPTTHQEFS
jgi:hypothetical protein